ncbi:EexN family lipoprotein, partial [Klebsiella pneumoniae]|uniref:EexN family lipoprotein n=1 Tax=Klebsiella pneumoniae TaxID=573 RepID=UPI00132AB424
TQPATGETYPKSDLFNKAKEEAKTTKWYKEHPDELKLVYEKCQKSGDATENCKNANEAHYQIKQLNAPTPDLNNLEE